MSTTRDEVHRLVDAVPDERLAAIGEALRAVAAAGSPGEEVPELASQPLRRFTSAGALSAEHDLAARAEAVLGTEPGTVA